MRAGEMVGMKVRSERGENLGEVGDLVVSLDTGDVRYAVLKFDPAILSGERLFAVPTRDLQMARDGKHLLTG